MARLATRARTALEAGSHCIGLVSTYVGSNTTGTDLFRYEAPASAPGAPPVLVKARRVQVPYAVLSTWQPAEPRRC